MLQDAHVLLKGDKLASKKRINCDRKVWNMMLAVLKFMTTSSI